MTCSLKQNNNNDNDNNNNVKGFNPAVISKVG